uniref:Uncharacterized protein n=1 Tax=Plectus sambesii TaxID=2011161 RepID=A0A914XKT2_9BILA
MTVVLAARNELLPIELVARATASSAAVAITAVAAPSFSVLLVHISARHDAAPSRLAANLSSSRSSN